MRATFLMLFVLGGCAPEAEEAISQAAPAASAAPVALAAPAAAAIPGAPPAAPQSAMMMIPTDPDSLKKLEAMGYTVHADQNHMHAPGVNACPMMSDNPVM